MPVRTIKNINTRSPSAGGKCGRACKSTHAEECGLKWRGLRKTVVGGEPKCPGEKDGRCDIWTSLGFVGGKLEGIVADVCTLSPLLWVLVWFFGFY